MNKVFCSSCGHKNVYEVAKPKFCSGCGAKIGVAQVAPTPVKKEVVAEIEYEESRDFDLSRMRRDIVAETNSDKTSLAEIWKSATPEDANMTPLERRSPNLPEGEALLKQSQADCGSSRTTQDIDG